MAAAAAPANSSCAAPADCLRFLGLESTVNLRPFDRYRRVHFSVQDAGVEGHAGVAECSARWDKDGEGWPHGLIPCTNATSSGDDWSWSIANYVDAHTFDIELAHRWLSHVPGIGAQYTRRYATASQSLYCHTSSSSTEWCRGDVQDVPVTQVMGYE